jgi:DNA helicase-2/ATP-dependent DNA helicase PcrA
VDAWTASDLGAAQTHVIIERYRESLEERGQMDFVVLEQEFLAQLESGGLEGRLDPTRVLLVVDEYQDTNLLQESIYLHMAKHVLKKRGWFAIVGDDEQSLYRFRGATVELFVSAPQRFPTTLKTVNLNVNRRSSEPILDFANRFVDLDGGYQPARAPGKRPLAASRDRKPWSARRLAGHRPLPARRRNAGQ